MRPIKNRAGAAVFTLQCMLVTGAFAQAVPSSDLALTIPTSIEIEHQHLHGRLATAMRAGGQTGAIAKEVEELLAPHFSKEEQYALPPLGLLSMLAAGNMPEDATRVIQMTERLKMEMREMLQEHKKIANAVQRLRNAALDERKPEAAQFADALLAHAIQEEQILYPSAILVGEYLKLKRRSGGMER